MSHGSLNAASEEKRHEAQVNNKTTRCSDPYQSLTFAQFVRDVAAAYGNDPAVTLNTEGAETVISFAELEQQSALLARGLLAKGVGKGSRVGFIFGNGPSFAVMFAAITRIGAIAIPISTLLKANELVRVLRQSDVSGVILQRQLLGKDYVTRLCEALPALLEVDCKINTSLYIEDVPYLRWLVSSGPDLPTSFHDMNWLSDAATSVSQSVLDAVEGEVHGTDQVMEIYTSGSMAMPKGVKHTHGALMRRIHYVSSMIDVQRGQTVNAIMPLFWVGGLIIFLFPSLRTGAITVCTEGTSTNSRFAMGSVLANEDLAAMPQPKTIWALGMTETIGPYSYADETRAPGYPLCPPLDHIADGFEVRIADDNDQPVAEGEVGEIQVRGYALTPGLHKMDRDGYFTADGYYHTGDMGVQEGTRIHFVGRNGDMIKTADSNVSPAEVELEMQQLDGVHSAYVVGIPDAERGQLLVAAVVPRDGASLNVEKIRQELRDKLSSFKVPREYVIISREEVPMLPSNKVARRQIEAMMMERLGRT